LAEWFAPKRYGFGSGLPISWQGWLVLAVYLALFIAPALLLPEKPLWISAVLIPATVALFIITARTTRGGWRWRWGKDD